jgi:hypothetical protein
MQQPDEAGAIGRSSPCGGLGPIHGALFIARMGINPHLTANSAVNTFETFFQQHTKNSRTRWIFFFAPIRRCSLI